MNALDRARIVAQLGRAALAWLRRDTGHGSPFPGTPPFATAREAVLRIRDGAVVAVSGMGAHQHASIVYAALRERFEATGHPAGLTLLNVGGHGGRGLAPGTLEELGRPGLCTRFITSHFETFHAFLDLAQQGLCELQCIPFGVLTQLFAAQAEGQGSVLSETGLGTFLDPRVGRGSPSSEPAGEQLVSVAGDQLRYRIPAIDVAIFNAPAADAAGNLYGRHCAVLGESLELARAARRNHGTVIANVGRIVAEDRARILLPAEAVDAVVVHPDTEQTAGVFHRRFWPMFTTESDVAMADGLARIRFINSLLPSLARRSAADAALARLAAFTLLGNVGKDARVTIGTGLPEEVAPAIFEAGLLEDLTLEVESGVVGGLPAPGVYFGAALNPTEIVSSFALFARCRAGLDATCLGALQVDSLGNVNVSKRGDGPRHYVGPGGFMDFCTAARTIVFVCAWMQRGEIAVEDGKLRIVRRGAPKFVERVSEVTFDAARARAAGKRVFYVTHAGVFQLTARGVTLVSLMPGVALRQDVLQLSHASLQLPESGRVPRVPRAIVTGEARAFRRLLRTARARALAETPATNAQAAPVD
jgi:propionate CoA-transferase